MGGTLSKPKLRLPSDSPPPYSIQEEKASPATSEIEKAKADTTDIEEASPDTIDSEKEKQDREKQREERVADELESVLKNIASIQKVNNMQITPPDATYSVSHLPHRKTAPDNRIADLRTDGERRILPSVDLSFGASR